MDVPHVYIRGDNPAKLGENWFFSLHVQYSHCIIISDLEKISLTQSHNGPKWPTKRIFRTYDATQFSSHIKKIIEHKS